MAKKNNRNTKSRIIAAAWKLFYEQGYEDTTVEAHQKALFTIISMARMPSLVPCRNCSTISIQNSFLH